MDLQNKMRKSFMWNHNIQESELREESGIISLENSFGGSTTRLNKIKLIK